MCCPQAGEAEAAGNTEEAARLREEAAEEQAKADKDPKALSKRVGPLLCFRLYLD